jgi:hypothetical protein
MSVVAVYSPMDEVTARALLAALEAEGIRAELREFHNPWEISWLEGRPWGQILVLEEDAAKAEQIIKDILGSIGETPSKGNNTG